MCVMGYMVTMLDLLSGLLAWLTDFTTRGMGRWALGDTRVMSTVSAGDGRDKMLSSSWAIGTRLAGIWPSWRSGCGLCPTGRVNLAVESD